MKLTRLKLGLGVALCVVLIGMLSAPNLIKNYLIKNSPELIGRQIALDQLKYNYFTSTLKAYDFKLFESNTTDEFVSFDTLIINLEPLKYLSKKIEIEQFI